MSKGFLSWLKGMILGSLLAIVSTMAGRRLARILATRRMTLGEEKRLYRAIARNIPHGIVAVFDQSLRTLFIDGQGLSDIGLNRAEIEGRNFSVWPKHVRPVLEDIFRKALDGETTSIELAFGARVYLVHAAPLIEDTGLIRRGLVLAEEITSLKVVQEQLIEAKLSLEDANELLRHLSETDPLVGIANRRKFDKVLAMEWRRAIRDSRPISLLMIDVDFFKAFNDAYGHLEGDECLRRIGQAIAGVAQRPSDLAARFGGEEFVVLLPDTDGQGAEEVSQRVHQAVADAAIAHCGSVICPWVTVSVGMATCVPANGACDTELVAAADDALYEAKSRGRNRSWVMLVLGRTSAP